MYSLTILFRDVLPDKHWWRFLYGSVILLICLVVCLVGAGIYAKTTFVIFLVVMVSISSVLVRLVEIIIFVQNIRDNVEWR